MTTLGERLEQLRHDDSWDRAHGALPALIAVARTAASDVESGDWPPLRNVVDALKRRLDDLYGDDDTSETAVRPFRVFSGMEAACAVHRVVMARSEKEAVQLAIAVELKPRSLGFSTSRYRAEPIDLDESGVETAAFEG